MKFCHLETRIKSDNKTKYVRVLSLISSICKASNSHSKIFHYVFTPTIIGERNLEQIAYRIIIYVNKSQKILLLVLAYTTSKLFANPENIIIFLAFVFQMFFLVSLRNFLFRLIILQDTTENTFFHLKMFKLFLPPLLT